MVWLDTSRRIPASPSDRAERSCRQRTYGAGRGARHRPARRRWWRSCGAVSVRGRRSWRPCRVPSVAGWPADGMLPWSIGWSWRRCRACLLPLVCLAFPACACAASGGAITGRKRRAQTTCPVWRGRNVSGVQLAAGRPAPAGGVAGGRRVGEGRCGGRRALGRPGAPLPDGPFVLIYDGFGSRGQSNVRIGPGEGRHDLRHGRRDDTGGLAGAESAGGLVYGDADWTADADPAAFVVDQTDPGDDVDPALYDVVVIGRLAPSDFAPGFAERVLAAGAGGTGLHGNGARGSRNDSRFAASEGRYRHPAV